MRVLFFPRFRVFQGCIFSVGKKLAFNGALWRRRWDSPTYKKYRWDSTLGKRHDTDKKGKRHKSVASKEKYNKCSFTDSSVRALFRVKKSSSNKDFFFIKQNAELMKTSSGVTFGGGVYRCTPKAWNPKHNARPWFYVSLNFTTKVYCFFSKTCYS